VSDRPRLRATAPRLTAAARVAVVALATAMPALAATCTVFDGLSVPDDGEGGQPATDAGGTFTEFPSAFLDLEDAIRACRWAFECPTLSRTIGMSLSLPLDATSLSSCAHWLAGPVPGSRPGSALQAQALRCVAKAESCGDANRCGFVEALPSGDDRCSGAQADAAPYCEGDETLVECQKLRLHHCGSARFQAGSQCDTGPGGVSTCSFAECGDAGAVSCALDTQFICYGSLLTGVDCTTAGLECGTILYCAAEEGLPDPCEDEPGTPDCSGSVARICDGTLRSHFRCGDLDGGSCEQSGGRGRCVLEGSACTPSGFASAPCDGSTVSLCVMGIEVGFDCASIGLACHPPADDRSAFCGTPP
jgi:hypothetical protein